MKHIPFFLIWLSLLMASKPDFNPDDYLKRDVMAIRLTEPLRIDGHLSESIYQSQPIQTFIQVDPDNGEPATEETYVWIGYDDAALYIGARLLDSQPDSIVGRMGRRDDDTNSDLFQIAIDSYHDKRSGYFFVINPSGAIMDGTISNDSWFDDTWDGIWEGKATIDEKGWIAEMRIPFSQLRFNQQNEYIWGIGIGRVIQRKNEQALLTYYKRGDSGIVSRFGSLYGIANINPPKRIEFTPYFTSGYSNLPSKKDNQFYNGKDTNLGLGADIKLGIGSNITIDATINPDFGQVEVDPSTINLSAYETYYEEKRPFFVEGANIFSFGTGGPTNRWGFNFSEPDFFYSRRIGREPRGYIPIPAAYFDTPDSLRPTLSTNKPGNTTILGAAKISGKLPGNWSIGGFTSVTDREYGEIDTNGVRWKEEVEPLTYYNLLRTQKEFNDGEQGLGVIGTYIYRDFKDQSLRDVLSDNALAFGIDGWTFFNKEKEWVISGWAGLTQVSGSKNFMTSLQHNSSHYFQRPDTEHVSIDSNMTSMRGFAGRFILNKEKGHVVFNSALGIISPSCESNDMGLNYGTDRINKHIVLGYRWYDPGDIFRYAQINSAYVTNHNFSGTKINEMIFIFGYAQFLNYWSINAFGGWGPETLSDTKLRGGPMVISPSGVFINFGGSSDGRKDIVSGIGGNASKNPYGDRSWSAYWWINFKLGTRLNFSLNPSYSYGKTIDQYVTQKNDENAVAMYGKRYIMAQIDQKTISADIRIDYTFTPTLSLQAYFQPFIATGKYSAYKEFKAPETYDFMIYGEEGSTIEKEDNGYRLDPTGGDDSDSFYIWDPDFDYKAIVGNAVLRWEFKPGSTLYLVWTNNSYNWDRLISLDSFFSDIKDFFRVKSDNVFAIKISYWIGR